MNLISVCKVFELGVRGNVKFGRIMNSVRFCVSVSVGHSYEIEALIGIIRSSKDIFFADKVCSVKIVKYGEIDLDENYSLVILGIGCDRERIVNVELNGIFGSNELIVHVKRKIGADARKLRFIVIVFLIRRTQSRLNRDRLCYLRICGKDNLSCGIDLSVYREILRVKDGIFIALDDGRIVAVEENADERKLGYYASLSHEVTHGINHSVRNVKHQQGLIFLGIGYHIGHRHILIHNE